MNSILDLQKVETNQEEAVNKDWSTVSNNCNNNTNGN